MQLVVFDLDTALCQTSAMDGLAMASAIKDVAHCQIEPEKIKSVHDYKSVWYQATNRVATSREINELRDRFSLHLRRQFLIRPSAVPANLALVDRVNYLQNRNDILIGLVSTANHSVLLTKSRAIGLIPDALPVATGEDSDSYEGILRILQTRAKRSFGACFNEAMVVADETWRSSAKVCGMHYMDGADYLAEQDDVPVASFLSRAMSHLSIAR